MQCAGKVVLVTGAQQGIGRGFVDARGRRSGNLAPSSKGAVMKCLFEILNDEAW
jgi:NAD(P)-dependent dehydrogenase (short-subunit alcohol dehydrogenase family)